MQMWLLESCQRRNTAASLCHLSTQQSTAQRRNVTTLLSQESEQAASSRSRHASSDTSLSTEDWHSIGLREDGPPAGWDVHERQRLRNLDVRHHRIRGEPQQGASVAGELPSVLNWSFFHDMFMQVVRFVTWFRRVALRLPAACLLSFISLIVVPWCGFALLCYLVVFLFVAVPAAVCLVLAVLWSESLVRRVAA